MSEKQENTTIVMKEGKYILAFDARNWIVSEINNKVKDGIQRNLKDLIDSKANTYHPNIQQAIIAMSHRMLKDNLSRVCKDRVLSLKELSEICYEKDAWMRKAIRGRAEIIKEAKQMKIVSS